MTPFLSIIIAHRNEPDHLLETIRSIRETSPRDEVEIIVVDDASLPRLDPGAIDPAFCSRRTDVETKPINFRVFSSATRRGHAWARDYAAKYAAGPWLMFTDAHMRFEPGWFDNFKIHALVAGGKTLFGAPYLSCRDSADNLMATYWGARFNYYGESVMDPGHLELLVNAPLVDRPAPADGAQRTPFEAPSIIGAAYFLTRDWFQHIGGLPCFVHWSGTDEWMLAVKTWLCGGAVLIMPDVRVRHVLYSNRKEMNKSQLLFNKLSAAYQVMPEEIYKPFVEAVPLPRDNEILVNAIDMMLARSEQLDYWRRYNLSTFEHDHDWLCAKFDLDHPADFGAVLA
jgi:glycosyltransferase involved in cell wall biosynthesis